MGNLAALASRTFAFVFVAGCRTDAVRDRRAESACRRRWSVQLRVATSAGDGIAVAIPGAANTTGSQE